MSNKIKAIILDDEQEAIKSLQLILKNSSSEIEIIATATDIKGAYKKINELSPDLVFLDIDLGNQTTSFQLLELFNSIPFKVIFVTAFNGFAIKAIKYSALDYILKPVNKDELLLAIENAKKNIFNEKNYSLLLEQYKTQTISSKIALQIGKEFTLVEINDIINCVSDGNFTHVCTLNEKYYVSHSLKELEEMLPNKLFFRTHKSNLINLKKIKTYSLTPEAIVVMNNKEKVPISRFKKDEFLAAVKKIIP